MIRKKPLTAQEVKVGMRVYYISSYSHSQPRWRGVEARITRIENIGELCCQLDVETDFVPLSNLFPMLHSSHSHYMMRKNQLVYLTDARKSNKRLKSADNLPY